MQVSKRVKRNKRNGVNEFVLRVRTDYSIPPETTRLVMIAWRKWIVENLVSGREVFQDRVGTYKLTLRRVSQRSRVWNTANGPKRIELPEQDVYVTFSAAGILRREIKSVKEKLLKEQKP